MEKTVDYIENDLSTQDLFLIEQSPEIERKLWVLRRENVDKPVVFIGAGTCGLGAGAANVLDAVKAFFEENHIEGEIKEVGCIGMCSMEPIMDVQLPGRNRIAFGNVASDQVDGILSGIFNNKLPVGNVLYQFNTVTEGSWAGITDFGQHPFFKKQHRYVLQNCGYIDPESVYEYIAWGGYKALSDILLNHTAEEVCDMIENSGLRGRGGGGFPAARKWRLARQSDSDQKYLICNADEGDPGAFMDRAIIEGDPHRLVEGMAIAAYAIGASKAYIYIRAEYPLAIKRLKKAIADARDLGILGEDILGSGFSLNMVIKMGAGAFVCGEETALMNSIEGKRGMPRPRPPYPTTAGLFGKPTVINNVETLANVPAIIMKGPEKFQSIGTATSKGTKVFALSGKIKNTGLVEIPMGTTLREIIFNIGGGILGNKKFKAVQIGGPSGGCITEENLDIEIDYESLKKVGAMMGSGGLVVMDEGTCMVDIAKYFMDFIQRESCGKCIPCREGTRKMLEILENITSRPKSKNEALDRFKGVIMLEKLAEVISDTSLCGLGQSAPNPVLSTLRFFRDEYESHVYDRECPCRVCQGMKTFTIKADLCTGCMICKRKCPADAIIGNRSMPHYIVQEKCISCGNCVPVCKFAAIVEV